jgi:hypothetical protein
VTAGEATVEATTTEQRQAALEAIAAEVRVCTRCKLAQARTRAVPGEGHADTEVMFVGEGPGQTEDAQGRPFVGRAGELLVRLLASVGWRRQPIEASRRTRSSPARPTNGRPWASSVCPGPSPTNMTSVSACPSPGTALVLVCASLQRVQIRTSAAIASSAARRCSVVVASTVA